MRHIIVCAAGKSFLLLLVHVQFQFKVLVNVGVIGEKEKMHVACTSR